MVCMGRGWGLVCVVMVPKDRGQSFGGTGTLASIQGLSKSCTLRERVQVRRGQEKAVLPAQEDGKDSYLSYSGTRAGKKCPR